MESLLFSNISFNWWKNRDSFCFPSSFDGLTEHCHNNENNRDYWQETVLMINSPSTTYLKQLIHNSCLYWSGEHMDPISINEKQFILQALKEDQRSDGRNKLESRNISISLHRHKLEASAEVHLGETKYLKERIYIILFFFAE